MIAEKFHDVNAILADRKIAGKDSGIIERIDAGKTARSDGV
jgi:hypothetical protein